MKRIIVFALISCLLIACSSEKKLEIITKKKQKSPSAKEVNKKKNVLFILIDDLGYSDIGAYNTGSFYETPNIDHLALTGIKFNNGYAASPVCSPSRYALLTGRHPSRDDTTDFFRHGNRIPRSGNFIGAAIRNYLPLEEQTMAETFKDNGYSTAFLGKWHLGDNEKYWPENHGFDLNIGGYYAGRPTNGYFAPYKNPRLPDGKKGEYLTDRLTDEAITLLAGYAKGEQPFFMYLSYYTVHTPLGAPQKTVQKYKNKANKLGLKSNSNDFAMEEQVWSVDRVRKVRQVQNHATYAAMVEEMDNNIGRILRKLEQSGLAKNTIIVFTSDNGGLSSAEGSPTSNLPLRGGKGWLYEGGIKVPFIIKMPNAIKEGVQINTPVFATDFYPTLTELVGIKNNNEQTDDGLSLTSMLLGGEPSGESKRPLFFHYPHYSNQGGFPGGAVRLGQWKLIERFEDGSPMLFNLAVDPGELNNLALAEPEKLAELTDILHKWYVDVDAKFLTDKLGNKPWSPNS